MLGGFPLWGRAASLAGSCSCVCCVRHHPCPTRIISSRKVHNAANKVKTLAKPGLITVSVFGLLETRLRHKNKCWCLVTLSCCISVGGDCGCWRGKRAGHDPVCSGKPSGIRPSFIRVCALELKASFIIFFCKMKPFVSEEISERFRMSNSELLTFWITFCFTHGVLNRTSERIGKAATVQVKLYLQY